MAAELEARIDAIAAQLHITTQTVLRTYIDEDWAGQMAETMMADLQSRKAATVVPGAPEHFAVRVAGRLLAALGQAMLYATTNEDPRQLLPAMDLRQAAEAVCRGTDQRARPRTGERAQRAGVLGGGVAVVG